jgi:probable F420-dependent oxidoreductase
MDIGISTFPTDYSMDIAPLAKLIEDMGFTSLFVPEHPILPVETSSPWPGSEDGVIPKVYADIVDPFVALGRASAVTKSLILGTGICLVPQRNPLLLAKEVATLDMYSQGRFLFGIGAGWLKEEIEMFGGDYPHRWTQTKEAVNAMKQLWTQVKSEYHGKYYDFPPVYSFPRSVQRPHPPVLLGGMAKNVFRRVVEYGDGWLPNRVTPEDVRHGRIELNRLATEASRDPESIQIIVFGQEANADLIKQFEESGANGVTIRLPTEGEIETKITLDNLANEVLR